MFEQALQHSSPFAAALRLELGGLLEQQRDLGGASALYLRVAHSPDGEPRVRADAAYRHARILRVTGHVADAVAALRYVVDLDTELTSSALFELASMHEEHGETAAAATCYYRIVCAARAGQTDRARAGYLHGCLLQRHGDEAGARTALSYVIGLGTPWSAAAAAALAELPDASPDAPHARRSVHDSAQITIATSDRPPPPPAQPPPREHVVHAPSPQWIPIGQPIEVHGQTVPGGVLVGAAPNEELGRTSRPALVDPALPVSAPSDEPEDLGYWPSYAELSPAARGTFLAWLAGGRRDPRVPIGYVFLFFYGLEHRALEDVPAAIDDDETPSLLTEVRELRAVYGGHDSFERYTSEFLDLFEGLGFDTNGRAPYGGGDWPPPLRLRRRLSGFAADGAPVPAEWAMSWAWHHPTIRARTPQTRCPEEYRRLFEIRYRERYADGIHIEHLYDPIQLTYRPASMALPEVSVSLPDTVDVFDDEDSVTALRALGNQVNDELDAYSRFVGRSPEARDHPIAVALLPSGLPLATDGAAGRLIAWAHGALGDDASVVVEGSELIARWSVDDGMNGTVTAPLSKADAASCAQFLERHGIGIEPDVRLGGTPTAGPMVLFDAQSDTPRAAGPEYAAAALLLELAVAVSLADGEFSPPEQEVLLDHLSSRLDLSAAERERLIAHLHWLTVRSETVPSGQRMRRRLADMSGAERTTISETLVLVATADGVVAAEEIDSLVRIHGLLGIEPQAVHRALHEASVRHRSAPVAGSSPPPGADPHLPATLPRTESIVDLAGHGPIMQPPGVSASGRIQLDLRKLAATEASTAAVSSMLGEIFADDGEIFADKNADVGQLDSPRESTEPSASTQPHQALVEQLLTKERWTRAEFDELAKRAGLMPSATLDALNERALDRCGEPLLDLDDDLIVNEYAALEFTG